MTTNPAPAAATAWSHEPSRLDLDATRGILQAWLRERMPEHEDLTVLDLVQPTANGGTGDNLIVTYTSHGEEGKVVARLGPTGVSHIHEVSIELHYRMLEALEPTQVPSPRPLGLELDPSVIGVPFMVMHFVAGRVPSDFPIYNQAGFLADADPAYRHIVWEHAMGALAKVHTVDFDGFAFLDQPDRGADGLTQHLSYLRDAYETSPAAEVIPSIESALEWLGATKPANSPRGLSWGDSRIGNMLFNEAGEVQSLLDWDQASVAGPLVDLGWWLMFDRLHGEDYGAARLDGLGTHEETVTLWESLTGLSAESVDWYVILGVLRLAIVRFRGIKARELRGLWVPDADNSRSWQRLLARIEALIANYQA